MTSKITFYEKDMTIEKTIIANTNTAIAKFRTTYWLSLPAGKAAIIKIETNTIAEQIKELDHILNTYDLDANHIHRKHTDVLIRP